MFSLSLWWTSVGSWLDVVSRSILVSSCRHSFVIFVPDIIHLNVDFTGFLESFLVYQALCQSSGHYQSNVRVYMFQSVMIGCLLNRTFVVGSFVFPVLMEFFVVVKMFVFNRCFDFDVLNNVCFWLLARQQAKSVV